jgi:hypothetical protein
MAKGIEALTIFIFINIFFDLFHFTIIGKLIILLFWIYTFRDSYKIAQAIDNGETVSDSDFIFKKHFNPDQANSKKTILYIGWGLIIIGVLSLINKLFINSELLMYIKLNIHQYSLPIILIIFGCYLLLRKK